MKKAIIYSTPTCIHCQHAKAFFKQHGVEYTEYNVQSDLEKRKEMIEKTGQLGVPVIDIEGDVTVGFEEGHFRQLLGIK